ncbi:carbohydrate kinase family protein [Maritalea porphyrae]|uniref:carbohydrate kinase family protein n=1 Tax=Maritalea porphyrae TaxID=880732 RepID=UPI0022AF99FD|nr:carbohydrate kinase [Maritalea porphyrae]MCZ4273525.1 carbohydrate kinase [Maritalea porphyrae]
MIVCCGEALIDMLPREIAGEGMGYLPVSGGAVFNTAITLGRLGEKVGFFTGLSTDLFGQQIDDSLAQSNVDASFCKRHDLPTTLAFVKLTDGHAEYAFYDENSAGRMITQTDLPVLSDDVTALHFGAISLIPDPCGSTYEALMVQEAAHRVISFDPNIRPTFIKDEPTYRARMERMLKLADIIKVSDEDLAWLMPGVGFADAARSFIETGASIVLMTKGGEGVDAVTNEGQISVPATKAEVVDTVGAGDSFNGGFLTGLNRQGLLNKEKLARIQNDQLETALRLAADVSAITVSRAGANPPWASEL